MKNKTIALAGNPNVGKSTVFNALTGMHQHTGNWPGKTVTNAAGNMKYKDATFDFIDLPGAYSLDSLSPDEAVTGEYIRSGKADIILIVADATCLERNLLLVKDILDITHDAVLCVNLMDEARKKWHHSRHRKTAGASRDPRNPCIRTLRRRARRTHRSTLQLRSRQLCIRKIRRQHPFPGL